MICNRHNFGRLLCTALYFFFSGVEYAVILPTLNGFLISLDAPAGFLGVIMASFSFTGLIASPVYGLITDKTGSTKLCIIASNIFEIAGNFLYFVGKSFYLVWISRLVAGIGSGAASSILGMLSKTTTQTERTAAFSLLMSMRQVGLLVGPGVNVFLNGLDFKLGPFSVNNYTSPGLFMAAVWALHTVLLIFFFKDAEKEIKNTGVSSNSEANSTENGLISGEDKPSPPAQRTRSFFDEFIREEVILCLGLTFMIMFSQTGIEAALTPMTLVFFDWGGLYNSYVYCIAGGVIILAFVSLSFLSKCFSDRLILLVGCFGMVFTYIMFLTYSIALDKWNGLETPSWLFPVFAANIVLLTISVPAAWVTLASLFSKVTSMETQAFNQGIRLVAMGVGQILGPLWAASMATVKRLPIMAGVDLFLMFLLTIMTCLSYKKLVPSASHHRSASSSHVTNDRSDENTPLLKGTDCSVVA